METPTKTGHDLRRLLTRVALGLAVLLVIVFVLSLPYMNRQVAEDPAELKTHTVPTTLATEPPTEEITEATEPTEPPADPNPYGRFSFQFQGRYLKLLEGESVTGIDVSTYQGEVDWEQVKASGVDYAIVRLGYRGYGSGKLVEDDYARANLEGAAAAGLDVGAYFFSQALSVEEALEEAQFAMEILGDFELTMPLVYDWEYISEEARTANMDARTLTDCSLAFMQAVEEAGYWPMLYFNTNQSRKLLYLQELNQYDFWLALYSPRMTFPYKVQMWQYTCTGSVPGIEGDVDINVWFPDL